jgi:antirestriction protein ArdC
MKSEGFGSKSYAREELTAELGAAFLCAIAQIEKQDVLENSAAYLQNWLKVLREDSRFIFEVAAEAQKAVDCIVNDTSVITLQSSEDLALAA